MINFKNLQTLWKWGGGRFGLFWIVAPNPCVQPRPCCSFRNSQVMACGMQYVLGAFKENAMLLSWQNACWLSSMNIKPIAAPGINHTCLLKFRLLGFLPIYVFTVLCTWFGYLIWKYIQKCHFKYIVAISATFEWLQCVAIASPVVRMFTLVCEKAVFNALFSMAARSLGDTGCLLKTGLCFNLRRVMNQVIVLFVPSLFALSIILPCRKFLWSVYKILFTTQS